MPVAPSEGRADRNFNNLLLKTVRAGTKTLRSRPAIVGTMGSGTILPGVSMRRGVRNRDFDDFRVFPLKNPGSSVYERQRPAILKPSLSLSAYSSCWVHLES